MYMNPVSPLPLDDRELDAVTGGEFEVEFSDSPRFFQGLSVNISGNGGGFGGTFGSPSSNFSVGFSGDSSNGVTGGSLGFSVRF